MIYVNDPYPDNKDPITGQWTPASYSDIKRMRDAAKRMAADSNANVQMLNMLKSMMK